ncbi:MAG TPA: N-6 DNA methylase [Verrucomicrobiae bacterium]|nr:N-6 DNA methylase [Verrucomicrobiae bacterium]
MKEKPDFRKVLESVAYRHDTRKVFDGFVRLAACTLACRSREAEYLEEAKRWKAEDLENFADALGALILEMEAKPYEDVLGGYYMDFALSSKGQQWNGEFHTPKPICDLMARMMAGDCNQLPADRPITVCEPACGAGAMILSLAQACPPEVRRRLQVTAIDINKTACDMCFINTTLWAIPTRVMHGDTIAFKFWSAWSNVFYQSPFLLAATNGQGRPPTPPEVERLKASLVPPKQPELFDTR